MTADPDQLLSEFIDAWNAGRRPDVDDYLARAPDDRRDELASLIHSYLSVAPTPDLDERTWEQLAADPLVQRLTAPDLPSLLSRLRRRARLTMRQFADAVTPQLGIEGAEEKTAGYLDRLERGELDPGGVSARVFEALGKALRVRPAELLEAASLAPQPQAGTLFLRAAPAVDEETEHHLEVLADMIAAPAPAGRTWDEVDQLFLGGR